MLGNFTHPEQHIIWWCREDFGMTVKCSAGDLTEYGLSEGAAALVTSDHRQELAHRQQEEPVAVI